MGMNLSKNTPKGGETWQLKWHPYLLDNSMVAITPARFPQPPFFRGYDSNATCAYYAGIPGHSIEHCMTLKHKVQSLIDAGWIRHHT